MKTLNKKTSLQSTELALGDAIVRLAYKTDEVNELQDNLDNLSTLRWDLEDKNRDLLMRVMQLESFLEGANGNKTRESAAMKDLETRYAAVVRQLTTSESNRSHAVESAAFQEKTIALAKQEMERLRAEKVSDEHLARQLIKLVEENRSLQNDLLTQKQQERDALTILSNKEPSQETKAYQAQVTRLLEERVKYDCQITKTGSTPCGGCLYCQLQQMNGILERTAENVRRANEERDYALAQANSKDQKCVQLNKSHEANNNLVAALSNENNKWKQVCRLLTEGLETVIQTKWYHVFSPNKTKTAMGTAIMANEYRKQHISLPQ